MKHGIFLSAFFSKKLAYALILAGVFAFSNTWVSGYDGGGPLHERDFSSPGDNEVEVEDEEVVSSSQGAPTASDNSESSSNDFVSLFTTQCLNTIKQRQGHKTLLCDENGDKEETGCEEWCQEKAESKKPKEDSFRAENPSHTQTTVNNEINELFDTEDLESIGLVYWKCERGKSCERKLKNALETATENCAHVQKEAMDCCHNPEECTGGGLMSALKALGAMYISMNASTGARAKFCKSTKDTMTMFVGMQGSMAYQCKKRAKACITKCQAEINKVRESFKYACASELGSKLEHNSDYHSCDKDFLYKYSDLYNSSNNEYEVKIPRVPTECQRTGEESNRSIMEMATSMATGLLTAKKECGFEDKPTERTNNFKPLPGFDRLPSNQAPTKTKTTTGGTGGVRFTQGGGGDTKKERKMFSDDSPSNPTFNPLDVEPPPLDGEDPIGPRANSGMGGLIGGGTGGGGGGLGGGLGGGGGSEGSGEEGDSDGSPTDVLTGYDQNKLRYSGGGGGMRGGSNHFNLRKRKGKSNRKLAAKQNKLKKDKLKKQFGTLHDNIFKRVSTRIQYLCNRNQLSCYQ